MFHILKRRSTHASKLERWIGPNKAAELSALHKDWYGPPIALADVPGAVYCRGGGDFVGNIDAGGFENYWDHMVSRTKRLLRRASVFDQTQMASGFATLQALLEAGRNGFAQRPQAICVYPNSLFAGRAQDPWRTAVPVQGALGAAAPGGTVYDNTSTKAIPYRAAQAGSKLVVVDSTISSVNNNPPAGLFCDRLFAVAKTMNSTASEAVTGLATRYQSQTSTDVDWCGGNFVYPLVSTTLPATAHNHFNCQYTDQDGNTGQVFVTSAGIASCQTQATDLVAGSWFLPLAAGDVGVKQLTNIQLDALVATGALQYVLSHPLFWCIGGVSSVAASNYAAGVTNNHINSAMQLVTIPNDGCLYWYNVTGNGLFNALAADLTFVEG